MTTGTPLRATRADTAAGPARQLLVDLGIGVRLALRSGPVGGARLGLTAVGVGLCVAVLLLGASLDRAQDSRQARAEALYPTTVAQAAAPAGAQLFLALPSEQTYRGLLVSGVDLTARGPGATPPPGVAVFPEPGTLVVSPALRDLLAAPEGELLRPRFSEPVVGTIGDGGLTSSTDLRFYRGIQPIADGFDRTPSDADEVAWAWGGLPVMGSDPELGDLLRLAVVTGAAVVLVPLLVFVSLMARLGAATRDRRTAALRMIGATGAQRRRILAGETLVGALGGLVVGWLGFLLVRSAAWLRVGGDGFFADDITPHPWLAVAVVAGVPAIAVGSVLIGSQRVTVDRRRVRVASLWARLVLAGAVMTLVALQVWASPNLFRGAASSVVAATVLLTLSLVPVLMAPLLSLVTRLVPARNLEWQLAARRVGADLGTSARAVAGVSVVVAAGVAMLALMSVTAPTVTNSHHADQDPHRYRLQVDRATSSELAEVLGRVRAVPGVGATVGGSYVWMTSGSDAGFEVLIADCTQLAALGVGGCQDGDVFRIPQFGSPAVGQPGDVLHPSYETVTAATSWTIPATVEDLPAPVGMTIFAPYLIATPTALAADLDPILARSFAFFTVDTDRSDAVDDLRNAVGGFGSRATVTSSTEWAADSGRVQLTSTLQTGLVLGGGLTLAVALAGLVVVAIEQLVSRRRALTLTVVAGVPRAAVARSVMAGAVITGVSGTLLGTAVGLVLVSYVSSILFITPAVGVLPVLLIAATAVLAVLLVTAATLPALGRLTRLESLRTE